MLHSPRPLEEKMALFWHNHFATAYSKLAGEAVKAALGLAERICANAPLAVRASREVVLKAYSESDEELWRLSGSGFAKLVSTEDFMEGPRAFIEKRAPEWKAR